MKIFLAAFLSTTALLSLAANANAQSIGVDFYGNSNATAVGPTETAGVVPALNFNVISVTSGSVSGATLVDNSNVASATLSVNYGGYFSSQSFPNTDPGDQHLFSSNLNNGSLSSSSAISVAGITYGTYDLYVYGSSDNNNANNIMTYKLTQGLNVQTLSFQVTPSPGTFVQSTNTYDGTSTTAPSGIPVADYVEFTGLTGSSFTLQFGGQNYSGTPGSFNAGLNGFQIVDVAAVPEPSTWALMLGGLGALAFLARRKQNA